MRTTWLVTGGAGYIGAHVVRALLEDGHEVVVLDDLSAGDPRALPVGVPLVEGTVTDRAVVERVLRDHVVDGVMHLAARKSVPDSMSDPGHYYRENVSGMMALLDAMVATGTRHLVLTSSAAVYGESAHGVVEETAPLQPINPYGETKLACEWLARDFARAHGLRVTSLRYMNVAGAAEPGLRDRTRTGLVPLVVDAVAAGRKPRVFGLHHGTADGSCVRDFIHVADIARAHVLAGEALLAGTCGEVYNLGSGQGSSVLEVIEAVGRHAGAPVAYDVEPARAGDPAEVVASIDRVVAELGWKPEHDLAATVASEWDALPAALPAVEAAPAALVPAARGKVVVVTASVGAGHNGAAREWASRLTAAGYRVEVHDFLDVLPARIGSVMNRAYEFILHWVPWLYEVIYRSFERRSGADAASRLLLAHFRGRLAALIDDETVAVLSTYPLASQMLGQLRRDGTLHVPAATFLTDSSVHRLWVSKDVDAHFALHQVAADQAVRVGGKGVAVSGPLVPDRFRPAEPGEQAAARAAFGLPEQGRLALLVAGSWGVGDVNKTAGDLLATGAAVPVVVCGRNEQLREELERAGVLALGWVSEMPTLLRAVDVLIENAGGLSSLEAMATGLPVVTYRPIPGHGRTNAAALEAAGVSRFVRRTSDLGAALDELLSSPAGPAQTARALALFEAEPVQAFEQALAQVSAGQVAEQGAGQVLTLRATRARRWGGRALVAAAAAACLAFLATTGADFAVAQGLDSIRAGKTGQSYLVVHPGLDTVLDAGAIGRLRATGAAVAVDGTFLRQRPDAVKALAHAGVPLLNAGSGPSYRGSFLGRPGAIQSTARRIKDVSGVRPAVYLSSHDLDIASLALAAGIDERIVVPNAVLTPASGRLRVNSIVLVECAQPATPCRLPQLLDDLQHRAAAQGFRLAPLKGAGR